MPESLSDWVGYPVAPGSPRAQRLEAAALAWERDAALYLGRRCVWRLARAARLWELCAHDRA